MTDNVLGQHKLEHIGPTTITEVHITPEEVATFEITPGHAKRIETERYKAAHRYLIYTQQKPCVICGVTHSTLSDPVQNKYGAKALETHHYPIERSLMNACSIEKIHKQFPQVIDQITLEEFVDSAANLIVLCDIHHRSLEQGIHHILTQDFAILPFLKDDYQIVATAKDKDNAVQKDKEIERGGSTR